MNKEHSDTRYIEHVAKHPVVVATKDKIHELAGETGKNDVSTSERKDTSSSDSSSEDVVYQAVIKGNKKHIVELVDAKLDAGENPQEIINELLIPAITKVGDYFEEQKYFLPQLIASAEAMRIAIDHLEPMLATSQSGEKLGTIVIATVAGDIHDIGKNLVALMLRNHGFNVIDLGKDVPSETIIEEARKNDADIIALSALMTTTMVEMKTVVELVQAAKLRSKIIIGGAVITPSYASEIEADGYSKDANEAVVLVKRLLNIE